MEISPHKIMFLECVNAYSGAKIYLYLLQICSLIVAMKLFSALLMER